MKSARFVSKYKKLYLVKALVMLECKFASGVYVAGEMAVMAMDKAVPGPNPNVSLLVKKFLRAGQELMKNTASDKTNRKRIN